MFNVLMSMPVKVPLSTRRVFGRHEGTWALRGHLKGTRTLGHPAGTWAYEYLEGTRKVLALSGTRAPKYLGHSDTWVLRVLRHLDTRGTLFSRLGNIRVYKYFLQSLAINVCNVNHANNLKLISRGEIKKIALLCLHKV